MAYRSPLATTTTAGSFVVGSGLAITPGGVLSTTGLTNAFSVDATVPQVTTSLDGTVIVDSMTLTPGAGTYQVTFNANYTIGVASGSITAQAAADVVTLSNTLAALPGGIPHGAVLGNGEILGPGVYDIVTAAAIQGILTLDAGGNPNAVFVFRVNGVLSSVAASSVVLVNGANATNVYWTSQGATALGANTVFQGTAVAVAGAASLGNAGVLTGRLLSTTGAVTTDTNVVSVPLVASVIPVGSLSTFALFTAAGNVANTGTSTINGDIGTNSGTITGYGLPTVVNGNIYLPGSPAVGPVIATFGVYQNGVLVPNSSRTINSATAIDGEVLPLQSVATVLAGQAIDVRSTVTLGTLTVNNRILSLLGV